MTAPKLDDRNTLIEQHLDLVARLARLIAGRLPPSFSFEDLRGAGYIGLVQAADRWDESRGVPFKYFAAQRIRGEILETVRRRHWIANTMHEITPAVHEIPGAGVASIADPIDAERRQTLVREVLAALTPDERATYEIYFSRGGQLTQISTHFGVSANKAAALLKKLKASVARELAWRGIKKAA